MAIVEAGAAAGLDMLETAISSALSPAVVSGTADRVVLQFPNGFQDVLVGSGIKYSEDGMFVEGSITGVTEYRYGQLSFQISGMSLAAEKLAQWFEEFDHESFFVYTLRGSDTISGSPQDDSLFARDGDDAIAGTAGSDYVDGGAGTDRLSYGNMASRYVVSMSEGGLQIAKSVEGGADTLNAIEEVHFRDGVRVLDPEAIGSKIIRLYDAVLHRAPVQQELEGWLDQVAKGWSERDIATYFLDAPEFRAAGADVKSDAQFVDFLYRYTLGRAAERDGSAYWVGRLAAGLSRSDALLFFSESDEHKARSATLTATGYFVTDKSYQTIALLYDSFADRRPDAAGLVGWAEALKGGTMTLGQIAEGFARSDEFRGRTAGLSNAQLVDFMYHNTLDRDADAAGRADWVARLDEGLSAGDLLLRFALSTEHQILYASHITGGIDAIF